MSRPPKLPYERHPEIPHFNNAHLIAAAPDLLAALKSAMEFVEYAHHCEGDFRVAACRVCSVVDAADAAIMRAEAKR